MKTPTFLSSITAAVLFTTAAHSLPTTEISSPVPSGYAIVPLTWEVETTPGGPKVTLSGTVEEVHAELLKINPNWDAEFPAPAANATETGTNLHKRDWSVCGGHTPAHDRNAIWAGADYLRGLSGQAQRGPGPRSCGRVSCSWSSAIWYCNDNSYTKYMPWFHIANAAEVLIHECSYFLNEGLWFAGWVTAGERWHDDGWFAIVAQDSC
ncbi:hypothetical protein QBC44DRAFT_403397 [Cladorrhinum sp. PSN332]|nr:hypothetical protein QBC44DRAFT_403397 [Cladorrhinum sp. PSN332]